MKMKMEITDPINILFMVNDVDQVGYEYRVRKGNLKQMVILNTFSRDRQEDLANLGVYFNKRLN